MDLSFLNETSANAGAGGASSSSAFREADFLQIILAEISNQDPFEPTETAKLVENMQKLQELANTTYSQYRDNLRWAQELTGQNVTVGQVNIRADEEEALRDRGLNPDVGFGVTGGKVESYRTIGESVWVTIDGKDYPIDNVQKLEPQGFDNSQPVSLAEGLLGRYVQFKDTITGSGPGAGRVTDISWSEDGSISLSVGGDLVDFNDIRAIGE